MPDIGGFMSGTTSSITDMSTTAGGPIHSTQTAGTSSTPFVSGSGAVSYDEYSSMKKSAMKSPKTERVRRKVVIRVLNSPKGHRVKLVGPDLVELAPLFVRWADRLGRDLRVVNTEGDAAFKFYKRPMVAQRLSANGICLFLTGSMTSEIKDDGTKWRVGLDELLAPKAPSGIDSPEFPTFGNISDDRKTFIGRVEGKFIFTMLYVPRRRVEKPGASLPGGLEIKDVHSYEFNPTALEPFLEHVFTRYERIMKKYGDEIMGDLTEHSLREFCFDSQRKRERTMTSDLDEKTRAMREKEREILDLARKIRDTQKDLALLRSGALDSEIAAEADRIQKLVNDGLYERFKIRHGRIQGMTAPIIIEYNGKNYDLGQFVVQVKRDGVLAIEHPTKPHPYHPHISSSNNNICLGAIRNDVPKLIGMERYAMVFQAIYEFLCSYNDGDKYNKIEVCTGEEQAPADGATEGQAAPAVNGVAPENPHREFRQNEADTQRPFSIPYDNSLLSAENNVPMGIIEDPQENSL